MEYHALPCMLSPASRVWCVWLQAAGATRRRQRSPALPGCLCCHLHPLPAVPRRRRRGRQVPGLNSGAGGLPVFGAAAGGRGGSHDGAVQGELAWFVYGLVCVWLGIFTCCQSPPPVAPACAGPPGGYLPTSTHCPAAAVAFTARWEQLAAAQWACPLTSHPLPPLCRACKWTPATRRGQRRA